MQSHWSQRQPDMNECEAGARITEASANEWDCLLEKDLDTLIDSGLYTRHRSLIILVDVIRRRAYSILCARITWARSMSRGNCHCLLLSF